MPLRARRSQFILAAAAAVLLFAGVLNLRSAIGSGEEEGWAVDPAASSAIDALVGAPARLPTRLDDQILAYQETLRADPERGETATALGLAYLQKARETGDPSYYPKAEALFERALDRDEERLRGGGRDGDAGAGPPRLRRGARPGASGRRRSTPTTPRPTA